VDTVAYVAAYEAAYERAARARLRAQVLQAFGVQAWAVGLPWQPGDVERPSTSRMHSAYHARRRRRGR
jgi:hypothetical protein